MANSMPSKPRVVRSHDVHLDAEYFDWIRDVRQRYRQAQVKASVKVNSELIAFAWELGRDLATKRMEENWGSGIVEQVSLDLRNEYPNTKGFSVRNLWDMKRWYLFFASNSELLCKLQKLETVLDRYNEKLRQVAAVADSVVHDEKLRQAVAELAFPQAFGFVPWGHHILIVRKSKSIGSCRRRQPRSLFDKTLGTVWDQQQSFTRISSSCARVIHGYCMLTLAGGLCPNGSKSARVFPRHSFLRRNAVLSYRAV